MHSIPFTQLWILFWDFPAHSESSLLAPRNQFHSSIQLLSDFTQAIVFLSCFTCYWNAWGSLFTPTPAHVATTKKNRWDFPRSENLWLFFTTKLRASIWNYFFLLANPPYFFWNKGSIFFLSLQQYQSTHRPFVNIVFKGFHAHQCISQVQSAFPRRCAENTLSINLLNVTVICANWNPSF